MLCLTPKQNIQKLEEMDKLTTFIITSIIIIITLPVYLILT